MSAGEPSSEAGAVHATLDAPGSRRRTRVYDVLAILSVPVFAAALESRLFGLGVQGL